MGDLGGCVLEAHGRKARYRGQKEDLAEGLSKGLNTRVNCRILMDDNDFRSKFYGSGP